LPEPSAIVVAAAAPLRVTVDPLPPVIGLIIPEILKVGLLWAEKFTPVTFAPLTVACWTLGLNV